jgi:hypothetical protein
MARQGRSGSARAGQRRDLRLDVAAVSEVEAAPPQRVELAHGTEEGVSAHKRGVPWD